MLKEERACLAAYVSRYIELNPIRAAMVGNPSGYPWSSYRQNALSVPVELITPRGGDRRSEKYRGNSQYQ